MWIRKLANGTLQVPQRSETSDGVLGDGMREVPVRHPAYAHWFSEYLQEQAFFAGHASLVAPERSVLTLPGVAAWLADVLESAYPLRQLRPLEDAVAQGAGWQVPGGPWLSTTEAAALYHEAFRRGGETR